MIVHDTLRGCSADLKPHLKAQFVKLPSAALLWLGLYGAAAQASAPPISIALLQSDTEVAADATAVQTVHIEFRANNEFSARNIAEQTIPFVDQLQTIEVVDAATLKADGRHLPVDPTRIVTELQPGLVNIPLYAEEKRVVVIYPNVGVGDKVSLTYRRHVVQPLVPGVFSAISSFIRTTPFEDARFSVAVPSSMKLTVDAHDVPTDEETRGGKTIYHWHYSAPAVAEDPATLLPIDRVPRVFVSSLPDWNAFGHRVAPFYAEKAVVRPDIQSLADRLTTGTTDRREQAKRLYEWVATHIRWVAIYIGNGSIVPHSADEVLENGYGDCKDQVTLLIALLRAKGIPAEPVLINSGHSYTLSVAPTVWSFNHCITYLPAWGIYADTTASGASFGTLPFADYGKPVVHLIAEGEVRRVTPTLPAGLATASLETTMQLGPHGEVSGRSVTTATGPYVSILRGQAARALAMGTEQYAATTIRERHGNGSGDVTMDPVTTIAGPYHLSGSFKLEQQPGWLEGDSFELPTGLRVLPRPADGLAGPIGMRNLPAGEPTPCYAGQQDETLSLILPQGRAPDRLPQDRDVAGDGFHYTSHYTFDGHVLVARRHFVSTFSEPLCHGAVRSAVAAAFEAIRRDLETRITVDTEK